MPGPAYRIETPRLVIRCWEPKDAPQLKAAIDASLEHLRPWMPWAEDEPEELDRKVERIRQFRGKFDLDQDYVYGIFSRNDTHVLGGTGLHTRVGPNAFEIGYWVRAGSINRGLATETAAALTRVAFEIAKVERIEIHCDPENVRSAAVPRKLGYTHDATLRRRTTRSGQPRDTMIWTLFADEYPSSPAAQAALEAFDALGRKLL
jgi:RimJ/RimL family protein N-acetyltransferase